MSVCFSPPFRERLLRVESSFREWQILADTCWQGVPMRWSNPMQMAGQVECKQVVKWDANA